MDTESEFKKSVIEPSFINYPAMDWGMIQKACEFYSHVGYKQKETPWIIPENYGKVTKPHRDRSFIHQNDMFLEQNNELVGSAEQGFIYLLLNDHMPYGKYFSVTPCFRTDKYDRTHFPWFMKVELFIYPEKDCEKAFQTVVEDALLFFNIHSGFKCELIQLNDTYDINLHGLEIGSYGIRKIEEKTFVYGTGLALPRFSLAKNG